MTGQCKAMLKLALCVLTLVACFHAGRSAASEVVIYNKGNTTAYLARVEAVSFLGVTRYRAIGWVKLEKGEHATIYDADDPDPFYVGYTYLDEADVDHVSVTHPEESEDSYVHYSDKRFCVTPHDEFDYWGKTIEDMQTCKPGFVPMQFALYFDVRSDSYDNVTEHYIIEPDYNLEYASADPEFNKPIGPGKVDGLAPILNAAVDRATRLKSFLANHQPPITNLELHWCMTDAAVQRQSWEDPQSARASALGSAVQNFLDTHDFSAEADRASTVPIGWVRGNLLLTLRIYETSGAFEVLEAPGCGDGMQDVVTIHMQFQHNPDAQTSAQQVPAAPILPRVPSELHSNPGASINEQMAAAIFNKNPFTVSKLLAAGADVNANMKSGMTPLHSAAILNAKDVAVVLLAHGANVNTADDEGSTPLHWAAEGNARAVAELLLAHGANVNARDRQGRTPLRRALAQKASAVADLLRAHGGTE
jgi:hypothetical protein